MNPQRPSTASAGHSLDANDLVWLQGLARALLRDVGRADDLVQDTVVAALRTSPGRVHSKRDWLRSVARRLALRQQRDEIRRRDHESLAASSGEAPSSEALVAAAQAAEKVAQVARGLEEPIRRTVLERYLEGLSVEEIAERSGIKADTVRWRLRRGLAQMRSKLSSVHTEDSNTQGHWALALIPLASFKSPTLGATSVGVAAVLPTAVMSMKTLALAAVALLVAGALWIQRSPTAPMVRTDMIEPDAESVAEIELEESGALARVTIAPSGAEAQSPPEGEEPALADGTLAGKVVDDRGRGIEGATVYLIDLADLDQGRARDLPRTTTDRRGRFQLTSFRTWMDQHPLAHVRAVANGFLRSEEISLPSGQAAKRLEITLTRGRSIEGRVSEIDGRPVRNLPMLVHSPFVGDDAVSVSWVKRSAAIRNLAPPENWPHQQCEGTTASNGAVTFQGVEEGDYVVRSLDPGWEILAPRVARGGDNGHEWIAERRFSVRLIANVRGVGRKARDEAPFLDRPMLSAKLRVNLGLADGTTIDTGQWYAKGNGEILFALTQELVPDQDLSLLASVQFYGSAKLESEEIEWKSPVIDRDTMLRRGAAEVTLKFRGKPSRNRPDSEDPDGSEDAAPVPPKVAVEFDVRFRGSGAPFSGDLLVEWSVTDPENRRRRGDSRGKPLRNGRYRAFVPSGEVALTLKDASASGSLPNWAQTRTIERSGSQVVFAEFDEGGAVDLMQPEGWRGEWFVRASYRENPNDPWFGSWNYSTPAASLRLSSLKPAEWRFQIRRAPGGEPDETRTVVVVPGDSLQVD